MLATLLIREYYVVPSSAKKHFFSLCSHDVDNLPNTRVLRGAIKYQKHFFSPVATLLAGPRSQKGSVAWLGPCGDGFASRCKGYGSYLLLSASQNHLSALL